MPSLTDGNVDFAIPAESSADATYICITVLAVHATDPLPISTTIRKCASEFKKVTFT